MNKLQIHPVIVGLLVMALIVAVVALSSGDCLNYSR